jgi:protein-S-isoprenylcysteine O-methyltransferase Ste14
MDPGSADAKQRDKGGAFKQDRFPDAAVGPLLFLCRVCQCDFPAVSSQEFFHSTVVAWSGVLVCLAGLVLLFLSLVSFGKSFRVGIDQERPDKLVTTGVFAFSRNPIYVAFGLVLLGQFLVFPNWILWVYMVAAIGVIHRQVLREEEFLRKHYGQEYSDYCERVGRYL